jgi:hypothetical protein
MNHARLLLEDSLPAEVDDAFQAEDFVILFPPMANQDRVRLWERNELKF